MSVARARALTPSNVKMIYARDNQVEMSVARARALTRFTKDVFNCYLCVEMSIARKRVFPYHHLQKQLNIRDKEINVVLIKKSPFTAIFLELSLRPT